jgi:hypothetical protein
VAQNHQSPAGIHDADEISLSWDIVTQESGYGGEHGDLLVDQAIPLICVDQGMVLPRMFAYPHRRGVAVGDRAPQIRDQYEPEVLTDGSVGKGIVSPEHGAWKDAG